jgi:hypothetical protein
MMTDSRLFVLTAVPPFSIDDRMRKSLIRALLEDLAKLNNGKEAGRLSSAGLSPMFCFIAQIPNLITDVALSLSALKTLGKHPVGARALASSETLSLLFALADQYKDNADALCEALRCIANTMLLVEEARRIVISDEVKGGESSVLLLEVRFLSAVIV